MGKKKLFSLALALALVCGLLAAPAQAAGEKPGLDISGQGKANQTLILRGLTKNCYGVQLTLELDRIPSGRSFSPNSAFREEEVYYACLWSGSRVTLYITSTQPMEEDGALRLGMLSADSAFQIRSATDLRLYDMRTAATDEYASVTIGTGGGSGTGGGGGGSTGGGGGSVGTGEMHAIRLRGEASHGQIKITPPQARAGATVSLTVLPDEGYRLETLTVTGAQGEAVTLLNLGGGKYSFTMPAGDVEVEASFTPDTMPFHDVKPDMWFYDAVRYVYQNGIMKGTDPTVFSPDEPVTRGMIVTMLYRLEGSPNVAASSFADVPEQAYYAPAVAWAAEKELVKGYDAQSFGPEDPITREQLATIFHRYAGYKGFDVSARADLSGFADAEKLNEWAREPMAWANKVGLVNGVDTVTLQPEGTADRAQAAAMFQRFGQKVAGSGSQP